MAEAVMPDERLKQTPFLTRLMRKPELGAIAGLVLMLMIIALAQTKDGLFTVNGILGFLEPSAQLGILAIGAALLMIGGEFDLSVGSMIGFAGLVFGASVVAFGMPGIVAVAVALLAATAVGTVNGMIVTRTHLPSFIVTLGFLFILSGLTLVGLKLATGGSTQLRGVSDALDGGLVQYLFAGKAFPWVFQMLGDQGLIEVHTRGTLAGQPRANGIPVSILWFLGLAFLSTWILNRTRVGNWIFAAGGDANAARNSGVPVDAVKLGLFVVTATCATIVALLQVADLGSTDATRGFQKEFEAIIAAVIGGCLLTGGYGSTVGACFGAVIFGLVKFGIDYTDIDRDWFKVFLGGMLLLAVLFNNVIRKRMTGER
ncbi:MAG: ABC transporter permease [Pseudomonadota bacterium]